MGQNIVQLCCSLFMKAFQNILALISSTWQTVNGEECFLADLAQEVIHFILVLLICMMDQALASCKVDVHSVIIVYVHYHEVDQNVDD